MTIKHPTDGGITSIKANLWPQLGIILFIADIRDRLSCSLNPYQLLSVGSDFTASVISIGIKFETILIQD